MYLIIIYALLFSIPKVYLSLIQINFLKDKKNKESYILNKEEFKNAGNYAIIKEKLSIISTIIDFIMFAFWITLGLKLLESLFSFGELINSVLIVLLFLIISSLVSIPLEAYSSLVVDKKFGFTKSGLSLFIVDKLKSLALLIIIGGLFILAFSWILINIESWSLYAFLLTAIFIVGTNLLYPTIIAPMFNKFTPLKDNDLQDSINNLLQRAGFNSNGVFVMDASRRDGRLNAYFGGFGKSKRVILFDTLLEKISKNSLLAVLGHELGHFKHNDIYKMMSLVLCLIAILLFVIANMPSEIFTQANISQTPHFTIIFLILLSNLVGFVFTPIISYFSCKQEYKADEFGASLTSKKDLADALLVLVKENKSFPLSHPLYAKFYFTHPPLLARLEALGYKELAKNDN